MVSFLGMWRNCIVVIVDVVTKGRKGVVRSFENQCKRMLRKE